MSNNELQILLVEDSMTDAILIIRDLNKHNPGNHLVHLYDGAQALDYLFRRGEYANRNIEEEPKEIFFDLKIPKIDGLEVVSHLKSNDRTKLIPVVMMTSSREEKDIVESLRLGVKSYIVKPAGFENFSKTVADLGCTSYHPIKHPENKNVARS